MHINFSLGVEKGVYPNDIITLLLIKYCSNKDNDPNGIIINFLNERDFSTIQDYYLLSKEGKYRLSPKGTELLTSLTEVGAEQKTDEDQILIQFITEYCKKNQEVTIGNRQQLIRNIINLRLHTNFTAKQLFIIMNHFLHSDEVNYFKKFEYLFWKPNHAYDKKFSLENSRLYNYYLNNKSDIDNIL